MVTDTKPLYFSSRIIVGNPDRQSRGKGLASLIQIVRSRKDYVFGLDGQHSILKALIFRAE